MNDQASALRKIVQNIKRQRNRAEGEGARIVSVTSGKGGVGKTSFTVNLALSLSKKGLRVLIVDADFGLSNVDVVMGVTPQYDLSSVVRHQMEVKDIICDGLLGVRIVSGGSGVTELLNLTEAQLRSLMDRLLALEDTADVIIFDTGAGVNKNILRMVAASHEVVVVTTPEPTAIMDAYALVKAIVGSGSDAKMRLVVNRAEETREALDTLHKFAEVVRLYLGVEMEELGYVLTDPVVSRAVKLQKPFVISYPKSTAAKNIDSITWKFLNVEPEDATAQGLRGFLRNLMNRAGE
jgi:flagellar biosynthesis protein FlhG